MSYDLWAFLFILSCHWAADFVLQTHWQATNKSKNNVALLRHATTYTVAMAVGVAILLQRPDKVFYFFVITFTTHLITDYLTSRATSYLWGKKDMHNFFVVVGLDQLIHHWTLALTLAWLLS